MRAGSRSVLVLRPESPELPEPYTRGRCPGPPHPAGAPHGAGGNRTKQGDRSCDPPRDGRGPQLGSRSDRPDAGETEAKPQDERMPGVSIENRAFNGAGGSRTRLQSDISDARSSYSYNASELSRTGRCGLRCGLRRGLRCGLAFGWLAPTSSTLFPGRSRTSGWESQPVPRPSLCRVAVLYVPLCHGTNP